MMYLIPKYYSNRVAICLNFIKKIGKNINKKKSISFLKTGTFIFTINIKNKPSRWACHQANDKFHKLLRAVFFFENKKQKFSRKKSLKKKNTFNLEF